MSQDQGNTFQRILKNVFEDGSRSFAGKSSQPSREQKEQDRKREHERERKKRQKRENEHAQEREREHEFKTSQKKERKREKSFRSDQSHMLASFGDPQTEMDKFDIEFEQDMVKFDQKLCQLDFRSKSLATMWKTKLRVKPANEEEARSRNIIASYLTKCTGEGIFEKEPFNHAPPPLDLVTLRKKMYLTRETTCRAIPLDVQREPGSVHLTQLLSNSYDNGEFLKQLPVPRDGAFFIVHMRPNL